VESCKLRYFNSFEFFDHTGLTTEDIRSQAQRIPSDATHLALSAGGNDVIMTLIYF
jgi:hypothetical protein